MLAGSARIRAQAPPRGAGAGSHGTASPGKLAPWTSTKRWPRLALFALGYLADGHPFHPLTGTEHRLVGCAHTWDDRALHPGGWMLLAGGRYARRDGRADTR